MCGRLKINSASSTPYLSTCQNSAKVISLDANLLLMQPYLNAWIFEDEIRLIS